MSVVSLLGRGLATGLSAALVWVALSVLFTPGPDLVTAAALGLLLAVLVVVLSVLTAVRGPDA